MSLFVIDEKCFLNRPVVWTLTLHSSWSTLMSIFPFSSFLTCFSNRYWYSAQISDLCMSAISESSNLCVPVEGLIYLLLIEYQWTQTHRILIGLNWTDTYGLSMDISPAFVYFYLFYYNCVCVCQMLMDTNQMYFTLSCCSYDNFGEKYCRRRGPIRMLSCTSSCICSSHQVVSCTFVCL